LLLTGDGLRVKQRANRPGAQTWRRGVASRTDLKSVPQSWPVRARLGGETSQGTLTGSDADVRRAERLNARWGRAPSPSPPRFLRRGGVVSFRVIRRLDLRPRPVAPQVQLPPRGGDRG